MEGWEGDGGNEILVSHVTVSFTEFQYMGGESD